MTGKPQWVATLASLPERSHRRVWLADPRTTAATGPDIGTLSDQITLGRVESSEDLYSFLA